MLRLKSAGFGPTPGERSLAIAYLGVAIFGAVISFSVVNRLGGSNAVIRPLGGYDFWVIISGALGAYGGLYLGRVWLGHPGMAGWLKALVAIPVISFIAALIGGTFALPGHGTMFGPLALLTTLIGNPLLALFWSCTILSAHYRFAIWREERETIFKMPDVSRAY
ncbi:hypothetical protein SAMN04488515_1599 [Cognatiyoonia koreensis]|uniref:Uncharacterized protein n=1 Tax=Cognatiyoonia koreensis TaxID=364200 RepID=A0A1I0Q2L2_9RHOB|nr:hypothetical protein [Cognatiyoonia koreensis]SEW20784.1 hypothetical protein SAMN04488515_1599 [Cognatiyoonia koreensis]